MVRHREILRLTAMDRKTVRKYIRMDDFSPEAPEPRPKGPSKLKTTWWTAGRLVSGSPGIEDPPGEAQLALEPPPIPF